MSSKVNPTYIYHITHIQNLSKILNAGCLWCESERNKRNIEIQGIGYNTLKERRSNWSVPTCKSGVISDYVPFYFAPRSPMLNKIHNGIVNDYADGQTPIIHLVSKVDLVVERGLPFTFTNGHAVTALAEFYEKIEDLNKIDWKVMESTYWNNIESDTNRKWRRQAEFLVHNHFPVDLIAGIGVISDRIKNDVENILKVSNIEIKVAVLTNWYY
jgi:hypothetical protein